MLPIMIPFNIGLYFVPGNDVVYTITVQNTGPASVDDGSMLLIDVLPGELTFYNADMNGAFGPETEGRNAAKFRLVCEFSNENKINRMSR